MAIYPIRRNDSDRLSHCGTYHAHGRYRARDDAGTDSRLNQLPRHLHPHGTAILNTLQQVSGAIGIALYISIMSNGQKQYLSNVSDPASPIEITKGLAAGINNAFWFGVIVALVALLLGLFLRKGEAPDQEQDVS